MAQTASYKPATLGKPVLSVVPDRTAPSVQFLATADDAWTKLDLVAELMNAVESKLTIAMDDFPIITSTDKLSKDVDLSGAIPRARLAMPLAAATQFPGAHACYPIRGLPGVLPAALPGVNVMVIGVNPAADAAHLQQAAVAAWGQQGGSPRIALATDEPHRRQQADDLARLWPAAVITSCSAAQALALFTTKADAFDVLFVAGPTAALFAAAGAALSGTRHCAARIMRSEDTLYFDDISDFANQGTDSEDPSGLLLAAAALMRGAGEPLAAERLENAWLRTLEDGLHTGATRLLNPYSHRLSPEDFVDAVATRLGQRPRRLVPAHGSPSAGQRRAALSVCR